MPICPVVVRDVMIKEWYVIVLLTLFQLYPLRNG